MNVEETLKNQLADVTSKIKNLNLERKKIKAALALVKGMNSAVDSSPQHAKSTGMTFKEKIVTALKEHFPPDGASSREILDYCNNRWPEYPIKRSSLSPQLSRLGQDGVIKLLDKNWQLKETSSEAHTTEDVSDLF